MKPLINTQRTTLVNIDSSYAVDINKNFSANVTRFMLVAPHSSLAETHELINKWIKKDQEEKSLHLVILAKNNKFIGSTGYNVLSNQTVELGLWLAEFAWGKGLGFEVLQSLCKYIFDKGYKTIIYPFLSGNEASKKICKKLGCVFVKTYLEEDMKGEMKELEEYKLIQGDK